MSKALVGLLTLLLTLHAHAQNAPPTIGAPVTTSPTPSESAPAAPAPSTYPAPAAAAVAPKSSDFNESFARLRGDSQQVTPACQAFQTAVTQAGNLESQTPAAKAELLKKWPGFPNAQVQAIQLVLRSKNPPADLNASRFLEDYAKLGHCDFPKTVALAMDLQTLLKQNGVAAPDRKSVVDALDQYLQMLANKPGSLLKVAVGISLTESLSQGDLLPRLARKDKTVRRLKEQNNQKTANIQQALVAFANVPTSVTSVWTELHEAERLRMELARILFFP